MDMNCDERFKFDAVKFAQFFRSDGDQTIQKIEKLLVGQRHDLLVVPGVHKRFFRVPSP